MNDIWKFALMLLQITNRLLKLSGSCAAQPAARGFGGSSHVEFNQLVEVELQPQEGKEQGLKSLCFCVRVCIWVFGLYSGLNSFSNFVLHFSADALVLLQLFCTSEAEVSVSFTEPHRPLWSIQAPRLHRNFSRCWIMSSEYRGVQLEQNGTEPVYVCCYHCCSFVLPTVA